MEQPKQFESLAQHLSFELFKQTGKISYYYLFKALDENHISKLEEECFKGGAEF